MDSPQPPFGELSSDDYKVLLTMYLAAKRGPEGLKVSMGQPFDTMPTKDAYSSHEAQMLGKINASVDALVNGGYVHHHILGQQELVIADKGLELIANNEPNLPRINNDLKAYRNQMPGERYVLRSMK